MTAEIERLKTQLIAAEAEIARLQGGFDDLKSWVLENKYQEMLYQGEMSEYVISSEYLIDEINRITGVEE